MKPRETWSVSCYGRISSLETSARPPAAQSLMMKEGLERLIDTGVSTD